MSKLSYKTKGNANPQGKERVYFACHPEDFEAYFEPICTDIFATQNCAIFYNSEPDTPWDEENLELELGRMQLIVIPVTLRFLHEANEARGTEFAYAMEHHIPVLPLMQEEGLEEEFNHICGNLQFLDKNASITDTTALPYEQKLERFLKSVLLGDQLAEKVRGAFDAYIFLSYRKKDRKYAQELMRLIHQNDFCRDIAIWYDEFLVPGENFNNAIADAMTRSDLFTFVVTPNLLEPDNYVMTIEYPEARKAGKPILPAEMVRTDKRALDEKFENIPAPTDAHNAPALSQALLDELRELAISENDFDPMHTFFIGLAYLGGIDVETDHRRAVDLITSAAEQNLPEAMEKLADMYKNGEGVERNYETSAQWLDRLAEYWEKRFEETGAEKDGNKLFSALWDAGDAWYEMEYLSRARVWHEKMPAVAERLLAGSGKNSNLYKLSTGYSNMGDICKSEGKLSEAELWYQKCVKLREQLVSESGGTKWRRVLSGSYCSMGSTLLEECKPTEAKEWFKKDLEIAEQLFCEAETVQSRRDLATSYDNMGDASLQERNLPEARKWYEKSLEISEQLANELETVQSRRDLSLDYERLGEICIAEGNLSETRKWREKSLEVYEQLANETGTISAYRDLSLGYSILGDISMDENNLSEAKGWYQKCVEINELLANKTERANSRRILFVSYGNMGRLFRAENNIPEAKKWYVKSYEVIAQLADETGTAQYRRDLSVNCNVLGDILFSEGNARVAKKFYKESLALSEQLAHELRANDAYDDFALSCFKVALVDNPSVDVKLLEKAEAIYRALAERNPDVERYTKYMQFIRNIIAQVEY